MDVGVPTHLAIDIGGTNLRYAVIDSKGQVIQKITDTHTASNAPDFFKSLFGQVEALHQTHDFKKVGLALPIVFDKTTHTIYDAPNLSFLKGIFLSEIFHDFPYPYCIENDANCAALGEMWQGCAKKIQSFCCFTLGTGVGGAIVLDRKLWTGLRGMASELGHMKISNDPNLLCACGDFGCLEAHISATAIRNLYQTSPKELYHRAMENDVSAIQVFQKMGHDLGRAIASLSNILNIEDYVIAGRMSAAFDFFYEAAMKSATQAAMKGPGENIRIYRASLEDDAGLLGAAYLTFQL